jgi:hypothetical protein
MDCKTLYFHEKADLTLISARFLVFDFIEAIQDRHRNIFTFVLIVEVICVTLFVLLLWVGLTR